MPFLVLQSIVKSVSLTLLVCLCRSLAWCPWSPPSRVPQRTSYRATKPWWLWACGWPLGTRSWTPGCTSCCGAPFSARSTSSPSARRASGVMCWAAGSPRPSTVRRNTESVRRVRLQATKRTYGPAPSQTVGEWVYSFPWPLRPVRGLIKAVWNIARLVHFTNVQCLIQSK